MHILNPLSESVDLRFEVKFGTGIPEDSEKDIIINFEPKIPQLKPDEILPIQIQVDLSKFENTESDQLQFHIEAIAGETCVALIWLTIRLF